jgi:uncharacterized protein (DUF1330 family)
MTAYLIVNIAEVTDAAAYARYREQVSEGLRRAGGRYLVRGGESSVLEGEWRPNRLVVVEFPTADTARAWWSSADYAALKELRQASTRSQMVLVEGISKEDIR